MSSDLVRITIAVLVLSSARFAQQQVIEPWQIPCKEETIRPNLEVKNKEHIFGELKDETGAPIEKSQVILRKQTEKHKFIDYRSAVTDKDGRFDLSSIEPGKYRFLPAVNRAWKRPRSITCDKEAECEIKLTLELEPTDQPFGGCPVQ